MKKKGGYVNTNGDAGRIRTYGDLRLAGFQDQSHKPLGHCTIKMVGMTGFEPATSCSQSTHSAKLSYIPIEKMGTTLPKRRTRKEEMKKVELIQGLEP